MHVHVETEFDASADAVWEVWARQFGEIAEWASAVEKSRTLDRTELPTDVVVDQRAPVPGRETTSKFTTAKEYFTTFDEAGMTYTFDTLGLPPILATAVHTSTVAGIGAGSSRLTTDVEMVMRGPLRVFEPILKRRFGKVMVALHSELKAKVEG